MKTGATLRWSDICVQGVDLSLEGAGVVTIREAHVWVETIYTPPTWSEMRRRRHIARRVYNVLGDVRPAVVAVEQPILAKGTGVVPVQLGALHGVVRDHLWRPGISVADVHPSRLKVFATGKGKAPKEEMLTAARERLTSWFGFAADHNQADAMWLACMCLLHIGQLPFEATPRQRVIVRDCTWPDVSAIHV